MRALEDEPRPIGVTHIGLNVLGHDTIARALDDKMGYRVASTCMLEPCSGASARTPEPQSLKTADNLSAFSRLPRCISDNA